MKIGIIGAGSIGVTLARLLSATDHDVMISNSRGPETLADLVGSLRPGVTAGTVEQAAAFGDIVIEAVPFAAYATLPAGALRGKIVVSASNYYPDRDGIIDLGERIDTELVAEHLAGSSVVKAFNTIYFQHLATQGDPLLPVSRRRAIFVAGDDADSVEVVSALIEQLGFGAFRTGTLRRGGAQQTTTSPVYNQVLDMEAALEHINVDTNPTGHEGSSGHVVVIGAGPGLGRAYAERFLRAGQRVTLIARSPDSVIDSIVTTGQLVGRSVDATDDAALAAALIALEDEVPITTLVFNAVKAHPQPISTLSVDDLRDEFRVGLESAWVAISTLLPRLRNRADASILVTGGGAATYPMPAMGFLSATKAALRMLVLTLAADLANDPIFVGTVTVSNTVDATTGIAPSTVADAAFDLIAARNEVEIVMS